MGLLTGLTLLRLMNLVDTKEFEDFILLTKLYRDTDQVEKQVENFRQYFANPLQQPVERN